MEDYEILDIINLSGIRVTVGKSVKGTRWEYLKNCIVTKIYILQQDSYSQSIMFEYKNEDGEVIEDFIDNLYKKKLSVPEI